MSTAAWTHHCTACSRRDGQPVVTDPNAANACCTCCEDAGDRHGPGLTDGRGW